MSLKRKDCSDSANPEGSSSSSPIQSRYWPFPEIRRNLTKDVEGWNLKKYAFSDLKDLISAWKGLIEFETREREIFSCFLVLVLPKFVITRVLAYLAGPALTMATRHNIYHLSEFEYRLLPEEWRDFDNLMLFLHVVMTFEPNKSYPILEGHLFGKCVIGFVKRHSIDHLFYLLTSLAFTERNHLYPGLSHFFNLSLSF